MAHNGGMQKEVPDTSDHTDALEATRQLNDARVTRESSARKDKRATEQRDDNNDCDIGSVCTSLTTITKDLPPGQLFIFGMAATPPIFDGFLHNYIPSNHSLCFC